MTKAARDQKYIVINIKLWTIPPAGSVQAVKDLILQTINEILDYFYGDRRLASSITCDLGLTPKDLKFKIPVISIEAGEILIRRLNDGYSLHKIQSIENVSTYEITHIYGSEDGCQGCGRGSE